MIDFLDFEGNLGDKNEIEILFVLREPNDKNEEQDMSINKFWMKRVINKEVKSTRYVNVLGALAGLILNKPASSFDERIELLKKCAYINLSPFEGKANASKKYWNILKAFDINISEQNNIDFLSSAENIAKNRAHIINQAINSGCSNIVTLREISKKLENNAEVIGEITATTRHSNMTFPIFEQKNKVKIYSFWHPSYTHISKDTLKNLQIELK